MRTTLIFIYHLSVHKILFQFVIDFNTPNYVKIKYVCNLLLMLCTYVAVGTQQKYIKEM